MYVYVSERASVRANFCAISSMNNVNELMINEEANTFSSIRRTYRLENCYTFSHSFSFRIVPLLCRLLQLYHRVDKNIGRTKNIHRLSNSERRIQHNKHFSLLYILTYGMLTIYVVALTWNEKRQEDEKKLKI